MQTRARRAKKKKLTTSTHLISIEGHKKKNIRNTWVFVNSREDWLTRHTWEQSNQQEKLQGTTKHGTGQEITKAHTRQGEDKTGIMTD